MTTARDSGDADSGDGAAEAADAILALLDNRQQGATICPSEAARKLAGEAADWRARMPQIHHAVDRLREDGRIVLTWKENSLDRRDGPYRIARATP